MTSDTATFFGYDKNFSLSLLERLTSIPTIGRDENATKALFYHPSDDESVHVANVLCMNTVMSLAIVSSRQ